MSKCPADPVQVEFSVDVLRRIRCHARSSMDAEICGVLIGRVTEGSIIIENAIPGAGAREAGTHVTFTQETWAHVYKIKDAEYADDRILGWYHSHPGFGIFLSEQDLFIHRNFFSDPNQVAWVVDPHSEEEGCFAWSGGEIRRVDRLTVIAGSHARTGSEFDLVKNPGDLDGNHTPASSKRSDSEFATHKSVESPYKWAILTLSHVFLFLLGFALASFLFPAVIVKRVPIDSGIPQSPASPATPVPYGEKHK